MRRAMSLTTLGVMLLALPVTFADEGMWLFNNPPRKALAKYDFEPTDKWLEHLQKSSVRFNSGGSGSFVSADGLVMTNHHVGLDTLQKISTKDKDYVKTGYYAKTQAEEVKAVDEELNVLMSIEDVTDRVNAAVKPGMNPADAQKARRAATNTIEKESQDKTGMRSDVVTLYQGGQYHLYRYKKYTDIRLVFAPEEDIGFFGGDPDNFEYPRYCLDVCFFRVYENDKPAKIEHYLKWSDAGAKDRELVFISGHPGRTERLYTLAHLEHLRDRQVPLTLNVLRRREVLLKSYSDRSIENARRAHDELFSIQNSRKARLGQLAGLQDPALIGKKRAEEAALQEQVVKDSKSRESYGDAWDLVAASLKEYDKIFVSHYLLERRNGFNSQLFGIARTLVRLAEEGTKPNAERLREYSEAALESLKQDLFSEAPIYEDMETIKLADSLGMLIEMAGADNDGVGHVLNGKSPQQRAAELVQGTKLKDVAVRKQLAEGGQSAIESSSDPMIQLARIVDGPSRQIRKAYEEKVDEPQRQAYAKIANAIFAAKGKDTYPDATFTLRLAFGVVKGYEENGKMLPPWTTLGGAFEHAEAHQHKDPFDLPKRWMERKSRLKLDTPFNFVATLDAVGGNSGSPVVNRQGELVGILFDGNLHSLSRNFVYSENRSREILVHSAGIIEALRKIYDAEKLAGELTGK